MLTAFPVRNIAADESSGDGVAEGDASNRWLHGQIEHLEDLLDVGQRRVCDVKDVLIPHLELAAAEEGRWIAHIKAVDDAHRALTSRYRCWRPDGLRQRGRLLAHQVDAGRIGAPVIQATGETNGFK
jgi:hypothetical protein